MQELAATIQDNLETLTEAYEQRLREIADYEEMAEETRFDIARYDLGLVVSCLEAGDDAELVESVRDGAGERSGQSVAPESLMQALMALEETLIPSVNEVESATFLWRALSRARDVVLRRADGTEAEFTALSEDVAGLMDVMDVALWELDTDYRVVALNARAKEIYGEDVIGDFCYHAAAGLNVVCPNCPTEKVYEGAPSGRSEHQRVDSQGNRIYIDHIATPIKDQQGDLTGAMVLIIDVTDRKEAEEALRESEMLFRSVVENSPTGIFIVGGNYEFAYANDELSKILGYSPEEIIGLDFRQVLDEESKQIVADRYVRRQRGQEVPFRYELNVVRKDGEKRRLEMSAVVIQDSVGKPQTVAQVLDITERKQAQRRLRESLERRGQQVQLTTEIAQDIATAPALEEIYERVVTLVKERFGYYHVQIFRYDPGVDAMRVVEGYGEVGERIKAAGHSLPYGEGVVGTAAASGEPVLASDVTEDPHWRPHPDLPETEGELAVPIKLRDEVLGVLDVQSDEAGALTEGDQVVLLGLAGQIAGAVESTRLLSEVQESRQFLNKRIEELNCLTDVGQKIAEEPQVAQLLRWVAERIPSAMQYPDDCVVAIEFEGQLYGRPEAVDLSCQTVAGLRVGGERVGQMYIGYTKEHNFLDEESALLGGIVRRIESYVERRDLLEEAQARAQREQTLREVTARIRGFTDPDAIVRAAVRELGAVLGRPTFVRLGSRKELLQAPAGGVDDGRGPASQEGGE